MFVYKIQVNPIHTILIYGDYYDFMDILFLLYVNDLPLYVDKTKTDMYADDVTFHTTNTDPKDIEDHIQTDLENINQWCLHNRMCINTCI